MKLSKNTENSENMPHQEETLPLNIVLRRLSAACSEAQTLKYVHQPILVGIMDLFEGGHIAAIYLQDLAEAAKKYELRKK